MERKKNLDVNGVEKSFIGINAKIEKLTFVQENVLIVDIKDTLMRCQKIYGDYKVIEKHNKI